MKRIDAINQIQNVGRFNNCQCPGLQFGKDTIIYGRNTQGKSTLVSIFRSLQKGDPEIIVGRKTFGVNSQQKIEIRFKDENGIELIVFPSSKWDFGYDDILIFDNDFITANVFEGDKISYDQQWNLNEIIIGEQGKDLSAQIIMLQAELDNIKNEKRKLTSRYQELVPRIYTDAVNLENFCNINVPETIDPKISSIKEELDLIKNKDDIVRSLNQHLIIFSRINFDSVFSAVTKKITFDPSAVEEHVNKHWNDPHAPKEFLKKGLELTKPKKETCVFCGQKLGELEKDLLKEFEYFFKGEYQKLQHEIFDLKISIDNWNLERDLAILESDINKFKLNFDFNDDDKRGLLELKKQIELLINQKLDDLYTIPVISSTKRNIIYHQKLIRLINELLTSFQDNSLKTRENELEKELAILELQKIRSLEDSQKLCDDFKELNSSSEQKRTNREQLRKELEDYSTNIFIKYKSSINSNLLELGADFQIEDMVPLKNLIGRNERLFTLVFYDNYKIGIDESSPSLPNFKNSLSESDKRLLAFAFFVSLVQNDINIDKKIIVFDDPFSSFDEERKRKTICLLKDIHAIKLDSVGNNEKVYPMQRIILTHERNFFREIYFREFPDAQTLKISHNSECSGVKTSIIEYCNVNREFPDDEIINIIKKLKYFLDEKDFSNNYESDCRIVLENILKRKYYFILEPEIQTRKSVRTFITKLENKYEGEHFKNLIRLCDDLNIELHDNSFSKSSGDHESILNDFFKYIEII